MKRKITRYIISFTVCLVFSFLLCVIYGIFSEFVADPASYNTVTERTFYILADSLFIPGVLYICFGLLVVASNGGAYEMLYYGIRRFISLFQKDIHKFKYETFYDYHVAKSGEPKRSFSYLLIVGVIFVVASVVFTLLWENLH